MRVKDMGRDQNMALQKAKKEVVYIPDLLHEKGPETQKRARYPRQVS
jgi:hypothetical protein